LFDAALWTAGVGGVLALCVLLFRAIRGWIGRGSAITTTEDSPEVKQSKESIPYAPAITLGVWLALVPKG
jgi:Flp pilus assembly protein protease CpaA